MLNENISNNWAHELNMINVFDIELKFNFDHLYKFLMRILIVDDTLYSNIGLPFKGACSDPSMINDQFCNHVL